MSATPAQYLIDYYAGYVQDEFRVNPKLTFNYGVRYEFEPGVREANDHFTVGFDRSADFPIQVPGMTLKGGLMYAGVNGNPTTQGNPQKVKVSPRIGGAYTVDQKTVIRGGYGLFWVLLDGNRESEFESVCAGINACAQEGKLQHRIGGVFTLAELAKAHDFAEKTTATGHVVVEC